MATVPVDFRSAPFLRWFVSGVLGRLSAAMAPIAMLVVGSQVYGSVAVGARLAAVVSISYAAFGPFQGRWLDKVGTSRGLRIALWSATFAGGALAWAVQGRLEPPRVDLFAAVLGFSLAVVPAGFRAFLTQLVPDRSLERASNVDAVAVEGSLILAPLVVAGLAAGARASAILAVGAVLAGIGASVLPDTGDRPSSARKVRLSLPAPAVMVGALLLGVSGGLLEPTVFARVEGIGRSESFAALLLAVIGVGSALGGILASVRPPPANRTVAARLLALHGVMLLAVAPSFGPWTIGLWLFAVGVPIAPLMAAGATLLDRAVPAENRAMAFGLAGSAIALGTGVGQAAAGAFIGLLPTAAIFTVGATIVLVTAVVIEVSGRRVRRQVG